MKIYLAHPWVERKEGKQLEKILTNYRYSVYNPFGKTTKDRVVPHDLKTVEDSDMVVVLMNSPSIGVSMEIYHAYLNQKPILLLSNNKNVYLNPWIKYFTKYCSSISNLVQYIEANCNESKGKVK